VIDVIISDHARPGRRVVGSRGLVSIRRATLEQGSDITAAQRAPHLLRFTLA
jgi:hypothetical protein